VYFAFACLTLPAGISNDVLGSVPRHEFLEFMIEGLEGYGNGKGWGKVSPYMEVMGITSPLFLSFCGRSI